MYVERNIKALLSNRFYHGKAVSIIYSERVSLVLGTQYVMFMRRIILPSVSCLTLTYLSTLSHKQHDFLKKKGYWIWKGRLSIQRYSETVSF